MSGAEVVALVGALATLALAVGTLLIRAARAAAIRRRERHTCDARVGELESEVRRLWDAVAELRGERGSRRERE